MKTEKIEDANLLRMDIAQIVDDTDIANEIHEKYVSFVNINYTPKTEVTHLDFINNN